ncbi:hypothetical protein CBL_03313 [Carabus blaptoides fortunei]
MAVSFQQNENKNDDTKSASRFCDFETETSISGEIAAREEDFNDQSSEVTCDFLADKTVIKCSLCLALKVLWTACIIFCELIGVRLAKRDTLQTKLNVRPALRQFLCVQASAKRF